MSRENIAKTLKKLREQSGLTADQVGAMIGKSGKTVNAWENNRGQPDADTLIQLCDIYNVDNILDAFRESASTAFVCSAHEIALITAYRNNPAMQEAVDKLLGIQSDPTSDLASDIVSELRAPTFVQK